MPMKKLLAGLPKKGEVAFVHYYHEAEPGSDVVVRAKGLPFSVSLARTQKKKSINSHEGMIH